MKNKLLTVFLIALLALSTLTLMAAKVQCPDCKGKGTITCPYCDGTGETSGEQLVDCEHCDATGTLTPNIQRVGTRTVEPRNQEIVITGTFENKETIQVKATVTANITEHSNSTEITFPPGEKVTVSICLDYNGGGRTQMQLLSDSKIGITEVQEVTCPYCDGTGVATEAAGTCTECDGEGKIECPTCDGKGSVEESELENGGGIPLAAIAAGVGVAVIAGAGATTFFLMKSRRTSDKSLRRLSQREFNDWVLGKLNGRAPTARDTAMGIDGYTSGGEPVLIKQSDGVGMTVIDSFASALARNRARGGTIIAFSFGDDAVRGKVRAKMNYRLEIEMLTVQELLGGNRRF